MTNSQSKPSGMTKELWEKTSLGDQHYTLLNLDHREVDERVMQEMEAGVEVFYDRRWGITETFTTWILENPEHVSGKRILALGAGVGMETIALGQGGKHLWINDLAPVSLDLCAEQLEKNEVTNYSKLLGRYEDLELPEVDLVVACFLVYNDETFTAMRAFLKDYQGDVILVNEQLAPFPKFLSLEKHEVIFEEKGAVGILMKRG